MKNQVMKILLRHAVVSSFALTAAPSFTAEIETQTRENACINAALNQVTKVRACTFSYIVEKGPTRCSGAVAHANKTYTLTKGRCSPGNGIFLGGSLICSNQNCVWKPSIASKRYGSKNKEVSAYYN